MRLGCSLAADKYALKSKSMIKAHTIVAACFLVTGWLAESRAADERGLVGYWKLQGDCRDHSGLGNHGTNHGADLSNRDTARFNGRDSYIEVPDSESIRLGAADFGVSAWVKCNAGARVTGDIVHKYDAERRRGLNLSISASSPGYSSVSDSRNVFFGIDNAMEGDWVDCGRPWPENTLVSVLIAHKGGLYAGIADALDARNACRLFKHVGGQRWEDCGRIGTNLTTVSAMSACIHEGTIFVATGTWIYPRLAQYGHPSVFRYEGGTQWRDCGLITRGKRIMSLASHGGKLYASDDDSQIHRYDGDGKWTSCGKVPEYKVLSMMIHQDHLYGGASTIVHRYAGGSTWENTSKFYYTDINQVHCLQVHAGKLYAGTWERGRIMRYDGDNQWAACGDTGDLGASVQRGGRQSYNNEINDLTVYNGKMYAGVIPKGEVWRYDGGQTTTLVKRLVNNPTYSPEDHNSWRRIPCMAVFQGRLFCGTSTVSGMAAAKPTDESGKVYSWEAGKGVSFDDDIGTNWRHIVAVKQAGRLRLYLDGKRVGDSTRFDPATFDLANGKPLLIGFGGENYFSGNIRNVRLYNRALDAREVSRLFKREK
jgi:hypothetical protein